MMHRSGATAKTPSSGATRFPAWQGFSTVPPRRGRMALLPYSEGNRSTAFPMCIWARVRTEFTGRSILKKSRSRMKRANRSCLPMPMTRDWSGWTIPITSCGARIFTGHPSAWQRQRISRRSRVWRIPSFPLTAMLSCSRERSGAITCFCPDRAIQGIHPSGISGSAAART